MSSVDNRGSEEPVYKRLLDEDENTPDQLGSVRACRCRNRKFQLCAFGVTFTMALLLFSWYIKIRSTPQASCQKKEWSWVDCGSSPAEARENKCHYEPMLGAWIPHGCFIDEPHAYEYHPFEDRVWYRDANLTEPIEVDSLKAGNETEIWTPFFHEEHCLFAWRRLAAAVERRVPLIDDFSHNLAHSTHCARYISAIIVGVQNGTLSMETLHRNRNTYLTRVRLEYAKCLPLIDSYN